MNNWKLLAEEEGLYPLTAISKGDLEDNFTSKEIKSLDNEDMREIANKMSETYLVADYWADLREITQQVLDNKKGD
jgi:cytochrome c553